MAAPLAYRSSQARDWIRARAVTYAAAVATKDPLTHWARRGIEPAPAHDLSDFNRIPNPLHYGRIVLLIFHLFRGEYRTLNKFDLQLGIK